MRRRTITRKQAGRAFLAATVVLGLLTGAAADGGAPYTLTLLLLAATTVNAVAWAATYEKEDHE